ncbi:MAG: hypothetical protein HY074_09900 [Deltaproteobacteria bacterium]|nr:hypothetical protein [Deltaproteobacteria bacterium]
MNQVLAMALVASFAIACPAGADTGVPAIAPSGIEAKTFDSSWLDGESTLSQEHVDRLVGLAKLDPSTAKILKDAQNVLGAQTSEQLAAFIRICENSSNGSYSGLADISAYRRLLSKSIAEETGDEQVDHRAQFEGKLPKNERIMKLEEQPDYVTAVTAVRGGICIIAGSTLRDAYSTFIHELTHIAYMVPEVEDRNFLDKYKSAQEYVDKTFIVPGGELEASIQGYRALIRTNHSRARLPDEVRDSFNDEGELVDRGKFSQYLLTKADYDELLRSNYQAKLLGLYNLLAAKENFLTNVYKERAGFSHQRLSPKQHRAVLASAHRLQSEIFELRDLRKSYLSRIAAEGISVKSAN